MAVPSQSALVWLLLEREDGSKVILRNDDQLLFTSSISPLKRSKLEAFSEFSVVFDHSVETFIVLFTSLNQEECERKMAEGMEDRPMKAHEVKTLIMNVKAEMLAEFNARFIQYDKTVDSLNFHLDDVRRDYKQMTKKSCKQIAELENVVKSQYNYISGCHSQMENLEKSLEVYKKDSEEMKKKHEFFMNHYNDQVRSLVKIIHKQQEDISSCSDRLSKVEETREKQKKKTLVKNVVGSMEETSQLLSPLEEWEQKRILESDFCKERFQNLVCQIHDLDQKVDELQKAEKKEHLDDTDDDSGDFNRSNRLRFTCSNKIVTLDDDSIFESFKNYCYGNRIIVLHILPNGFVKFLTKTVLKKERVDIALENCFKKYGISTAGLTVVGSCLELENVRGELKVTEINPVRATCSKYTSIFAMFGPENRLVKIRKKYFLKDNKNRERKIDIINGRDSNLLKLFQYDD